MFEQLKHLKKSTKVLKNKTAKCELDSRTKDFVSLSIQWVASSLRDDLSQATFDLISHAVPYKLDSNRAG